MQVQEIPSRVGVSLKPVRVLLIEASPIEDRFPAADFEKRGASEFALLAVRRLDEAILLLRRTQVDVILLDLFLEEIQGLETLSAVRKAAPGIPVVVLTSLDNEALALQALKQGAQDYLIKGSVDSGLLPRTIRRAIERKQVETGRRSLEERSLQMKKLEALGTLAGGVAHNFNNMLMVILSHSYFMLEQTADENGRRHLDAIRRAANRASALAHQLLKFSHRETGAMLPTNLNGVILEMEELIKSVLGQGIDLVIELAPDAGPIKADPTQMLHMIMNLVLNAREAIGKNGRIGIKTERIVAGSGYDVRLSVTDSGCGMSAEAQAHIFEPFFTTKGRAVATGLGLSTVHEIVEQHRGSIQVLSERGNGASFVITFPGLARPA